MLSTTEFYLRKQYLEECKKMPVFISGNPILPYMLQLYKQKAWVIKSAFLHSLLQKISCFQLFKGLFNSMESNGFYDWNTWNASPAQLELSGGAHEKGKKLLKQMGIEDGADYICIHARDNYYTDTFQKRDPYWHENDFRDCCIKNYMKAAEFLADKGIYVILMGDRHSPPVHSDHPGIIDYAHKYKSDFADVYLPATCKFFLGNTSAVYLLSSIFNVPVAYANMVPMGESGRKRNDIYILKKVFNENTGRFIRFTDLKKVEKDLFSDRLHHSERKAYILDRNNSLLYSRLDRDQLEILKQNRIQICENSPDEILWLAKEMNERIDGVFEEKQDFHSIQKKHLSLFGPDHPFSIDPPPSSICYDFVKNNIALWENT